MSLFKFPKGAPISFAGYAGFDRKLAQFGGSLVVPTNEIGALLGAGVFVQLKCLQVLYLSYCRFLSNLGGTNLILYFNLENPYFHPVR